MVEVFAPILLIFIFAFPFLSIIEYFIVKKYGDRRGLIVPFLSLILIIIIPWYGIIMSIINFVIYFKVK